MIKQMDKKWLIKILFLSLAIVVLALLTIFLPQRQTLQQRAYFGNVNLRLDPETVTELPNNEFSVDVKIEAGTYKVSAVDLVFNYDQTKMQIVGFTINRVAFNDFVIRQLGEDTGIARFVALSKPDVEEPNRTLPTGTFNVGTLTLKGIVGGSTPVRLTLNRVSSLIAGESATEDSALEILQVTDGSYTFTPEASGTATPTPIPSSGPSPTSIPTTMITPSVTPLPTATVTVVPTNTPLPTATGTTVPGGVALNFSVRYQGISSKRDDQVVEVWVKKGSFFKKFAGVNTQANDLGVYSGSVVLEGVPAGSGYAIFIKGPRHLAKKFCVNNQTRFCVSGIAGQIVLTSGDNAFDFTALRLEAGDLPNPNDNYQQDGVANSVDYSLVTNRWYSSDPADLVIADLNLDGSINVIDSNMVRETVETRYEDQE